MPLIREIDDLAKLLAERGASFPLAIASEPAGGIHGVYNVHELDSDRGFRIPMGEVNEVVFRDVLHCPLCGVRPDWHAPVTGALRWNILMRMPVGAPCATEQRSVCLDCGREKSRAQNDFGEALDELLERLDKLAQWKAGHIRP